MATTAWVYPSSASGADFTNPNNVLTDNITYATTSITDVYWVDISVQDGSVYNMANGDVMSSPSGTLSYGIANTSPISAPSSNALNSTITVYLGIMNDLGDQYKSLDVVFTTPTIPAGSMVTNYAVRARHYFSGGVYYLDSVSLQLTYEPIMHITQFTDTFVNANNWENVGSKISGGVLTIDSSQGIATTKSYNFINGSFQIKMASFSATNASTYAELAIRGNKGGYIGFRVANTTRTVTLFGFSGSSFTVETTAYFRFRHQSSNSTWYLDSSTDGIAWTNRGSVTETAATLQAVYGVGIYFGASIPSGQTLASTWDDINVPQTLNRYAIATGTWDGTNTTIWSYNSGGIGGALPPVSATIATGSQVYLSGNYTVTLGSDAGCAILTHTNGTLTTSTYNLTVWAGIESSGSTARTINFGSGTHTLYNSHPFVGGRTLFTGSNLTFNAGTSLLTINNTSSGSATLETLGKTFNNVIFNLGVTMPGSAAPTNTPLIVTGTPTINTLLIKVVNASAQTATISGSWIVKKLVAIGASSTNRLNIKTNGTTFGGFSFGITGTCYGQNVQIGISGGGANDNVIFTGGANVKGYIGSNSVGYGITSGWVFADPPKINTMSDPLTSAIGSNTNFFAAQDASGITSITTGLNGGGYRLQATASLNPVIATKDTYDLTDVWFNLHVNYVDGYYLGHQVYIDTMPVQLVDGANKLTSGLAAAYVDDQSSSWNQLDYAGLGRYYSVTYFAGNPLFKFGRTVAIRIRSNGVVEMKIKPLPSDPWGDLVTGITLTADELLTFKSSRIFVGPAGKDIFGSAYPGEDFLMFNGQSLVEPSNGAFFAFF